MMVLENCSERECTYAEQLLKTFVAAMNSNDHLVKVRVIYRLRFDGYELTLTFLAFPGSSINWGAPQNFHSAALLSAFFPCMAQCSIPVGSVTLLQSLISPCA